MAQELIAYGMDDPEVGDEYEMYKVSDVDAVLAEKDAEIRRLRSCIKCLVQRDLIKECPEKKVAKEIVKEYDNGLG